MDLKGSLVDCKLRIYPSEKLINFLETLPSENDTPNNLLKFMTGKGEQNDIKKAENPKPVAIYLNEKDLESLQRIKLTVNSTHSTKLVQNEPEIISVDISKKEHSTEYESVTKNIRKTPLKSSEDFKDLNRDNLNINKPTENETEGKEVPESKNEGPYLTTSDVDWLYNHLAKRRGNDEKNLPYLHELLQGSSVETPENKIIKRNPALEARCVKLRAQQEAREYRHMTKGVDNVRMRFPDDSISYQLKQVNRQLIAVGQFILSIFAGFMFGFKGVEWMIGSLDFGFRLLLGVMCSLVIALAEIYFLAKKLNEELNIPETVQLGGPPKFAEENKNGYTNRAMDKEHQD